MAETRRIIFLTYNGAQLLDLVGPSAVFTTANRLAGKRHYDVIVAASASDMVSHSCGITICTTPLSDLDFGPKDTVLVIGADQAPLAKAMTDKALGVRLRHAAAHAERVGSICTGVFALAAAGLLGGKKVATHWAAAGQFSHMYPEACCNADAIYVTDGNLWTSAGVTSGIDMALAIVEADLGTAMKASVARQLVVYAHRPGHQSQFSDLLAAQSKEDQRFSGLASWLRDNVATPVSVETMASHVAMSPRTFHRKFVDIYGVTPGKFFEALRLGEARTYLDTGVSVGDVALRAGFRSESAFRAAFKEKYGVTPSQYRNSWSAPQ